MLDAKDAPRVRVAVERCERSQLRVAIERALEDDDSSDALRTAIARVE